MGYAGLPAGYHKNYLEIGRRATAKTSLVKSFFSPYQIPFLQRRKENLVRAPLPAALRMLTSAGRPLDEPAAGSAYENNRLPLNAKLATPFTSPAAFAQRHFLNVRMVRALGRQYRFDALFFLQPVAAVGKTLHADEQKRIAVARQRQRWAGAETRYWQDHYDTYAETLLNACRQGGYPLFDLRHVLRDRPEPLYVDHAQLTGAGYEIVAEAICDTLRARMRQDR